MGAVLCVLDVEKRIYCRKYESFLHLYSSVEKRDGPETSAFCFWLAGPGEKEDDWGFPDRWKIGVTESEVEKEGPIVCPPYFLYAIKIITLKWVFYCRINNLHWTCHTNKALHFKLWADTSGIQHYQTCKMTESSFSHASFNNLKLISLVWANMNKSVLYVLEDKLLCYLVVKSFNRKQSELKCYEIYTYQDCK